MKMERKDFQKKAERILVQGSVLGCVMFLVTVVYLGLRKGQSICAADVTFSVACVVGLRCFWHGFLLFLLQKRENRGIRNFKQLYERRFRNLLDRKSFSFVFSCSGIAGKERAGTYHFASGRPFSCRISHLGLPLYEPVCRGI